MSRDFPGVVMEATDDLEFLVLGPLEVRRGEHPVPVRGWRERTVLAMLLLAGGETVTVERLVEAVWDGDPPYGAVKAVRNCVSALRNRAAASGGPVVPIQATPAGYRLPLEGARLDARDFRQRVDAARQLADAGQAADAAAALRAALALWRGPALAGIGGRIVQDCAARLDEMRVTVLEDCLDLELAQGRHRQAVGELQALARECPLRERVAGQLMLALYRSGRQAEALGTYLQLAKRLAEDLGIDPAAGVTRRYEAILRQDPSLDLPREPEAARHCGQSPELSDLAGVLQWIGGAYLLASLGTVRTAPGCRELAIERLRDALVSLTAPPSCLR